MQTFAETDLPPVGPAPFLGPDVLTSRCPYRLRTAMASMAVEHDLTPLETSLAGLATGIDVGDVHLAYVRYGAPVRVVADGTESLVCWTIPLAPMDVTLGRRASHRLTVGFVLGRRASHRLTVGFVLDRQGSTTMLPNPRGGAVVITTPESRLTRHFRKVSGRSDAALEVSPGISTATRSGLIDLAWRHTAQALAGQTAPRALVDSLEEMVLTALLLELPSRAHGVLTAPPDEPRGGSSAHARRAVEWASERLDRPISLPEWAAGVGVSVRHLQKAFHQCHGCTPTQYLLLMRLDLAHRLLRSPLPDDTVTSVAARAGFTHLSRFAAAYRAQYGASPSQTLRQALALNHH